jgi:hypothetical protein
MTTKTIEPDVNTPEGLLLAAAEGLYGAPDELAPEARHIAHALIAGVLSAASAGGFKQADIVATMLANCEISHRTRSMARQACAAAGTAALRQLLERIGLAEGMGAAW